VLIMLMTIISLLLLVVYRQVGFGSVSVMKTTINNIIILFNFSFFPYILVNVHITVSISCVVIVFFCSKNFQVEQTFLFAVNILTKLPLTPQTMLIYTSNVTADPALPVCTNIMQLFILMFDFN
jgi:hypothetical protein